MTATPDLLLIPGERGLTSARTERSPGVLALNTRVVEVASELFGAAPQCFQPQQEEPPGAPMPIPPGGDRWGPMTPLLAACRADRLERIDCTADEWPVIAAALATFAANARSLDRDARAEFAEAEIARLGEKWGAIGA